MDSEKDRQNASALLTVAAKVQILSNQAFAEPESRRVAGRLARDPQDIWAISKTIVDGMKKGGTLVSIFAEIPKGRILLHYAMREVSMNLWGELWNEAHPDQFGMGGEGEDIDLMRVWSEKVRAMIRECNQESILSLNVEDYFNQLAVEGEDEEFAEALAAWLSQVQEEDLPST
jgi:hypothetical protein